MANVANYTVIDESPPTLPKDSGAIDHRIEFDAPGVSPGGRSILLLRVKPNGDANLEAAVNGTNVVDVELGDDVERTLHEVIPANLLQASGNELQLRVKGAGEVTMSDVALLFKTTI